jgi:hypothetical protein
MGPSALAAVVSEKENNNIIVALPSKTKQIMKKNYDKKWRKRSDQLETEVSRPLPLRTRHIEPQWSLESARGDELLSQLSSFDDPE